MIVLAVSGALLASAIVMLGGKQAQTQATESVRAFDSILEAMSRQVASGYYNSGQACKVPDTGPVYFDPNSPVEPGANTGCIFIGKVFNIEPELGTDINILGRQFEDGSKTDDVSTLGDAQPVKVVSDAAIFNYPFGLTVTKVVYTNPPHKELKALAFMIELGGGSSIKDNPINGSRSIKLYGVPDKVEDNHTGTSIDISTLTPLAEGAIICMKTGNDKPAELTIGASGNQYSTNTLIDNGVDDVCKI
jgi:hypothetical protein